MMLKVFPGIELYAPCACYMRTDHLLITFPMIIPMSDKNCVHPKSLQTRENCNLAKNPLNFDWRIKQTFIIKCIIFPGAFGIKQPANPQCIPSISTAFYPQQQDFRAPDLGSSIIAAATLARENMWREDSCLPKSCLKEVRLWRLGSISHTK